MPADSHRHFGRFEAARSVLATHELDGLLVRRPSDIAWLTGFDGSNGLVLIDAEDVHLITDGRYGTQAAEQAPATILHLPGYDLHASIPAITTAGDRLGFQSDHVTVAALDALSAACADRTLVPIPDALAFARASKADDEIDAIRRALSVSEAALSAVLGTVRPGMTELEVAAELVYEQRARGATAMSFEPIVASGPNAALPHARPTNRRLRDGEFLLLDFGCVVDGYCSDITRMVAIGTVGEEEKTVYRVVLDALRASRDAARSGLTSRDLDAVARDLIVQAGFGEQFGHSLGHGVGRDVHEGPAVSFRSDAVLPDRAVITLEPGIYLPGRFGVRIEDMVVLDPAGNRRLTTLPDTLIQI